MRFGLGNRVMVVTAAAPDHDLGAAVSAALADAGAVVLYLSPQRVHITPLPRHPEGRMISQMCDVANERERRAMIGKFVELRHGRLDGAVAVCDGKGGQ